MNIILTSVEAGLADAWERFCGDLTFVTVHRGSIFDLSCDAVVSPANSFGFMDGGIDMLYTQHFGWHVQERLQEAIREGHYGEMLVGAAEIVETDNPDLPFLVAAPTMRVPTILRDSVNPYLAARAALLLVKHGIFSQGTYAGEKIADYVGSIAFPGLGTGVGRVGPNTCARQVRAAIDAVVLGREVFPVSWVDAQHRHQGLYTDRVRDLQQE
jgi:O-acetyl-ADP-ribose deacetylase (regulator of RNase III)